MSSLEDIEITTHAMVQFARRHKALCGSIPKKPEKSVRRMLGAARKESVGTTRSLKRLLNNGCKQAEYYTLNGWRFVVSSGKVVTIERTVQEQNHIPSEYILIDLEKALKARKVLPEDVRALLAKVERKEPDTRR